MPTQSKRQTGKHFVMLMAGFSTVVVKRAHEGRAVCTSGNEVFINYTLTTAQWLVWKIKWFNPILKGRHYTSRHWQTDCIRT